MSPHPPHRPPCCAAVRPAPAPSCSGPSVLVLDEATAGVDHDTAGRIEEALSAAATDRTLVVIAHRADTIARGHRLLAMPSGELTVRLPAPARP
ncbi:MULTISPECIES: hypothetical protein [unclassified Streptomyces]|uniref:hypothetical protein n=1 Tax=unclassified Streptomyces TaxID=2593676 RepID=UPI002E13221E|nr:hypothetical protein OG457_43005 [Streptomyces sp. NBC_01207]WTA23120.1 hypothetical protein OG365_36685 [Streptomyces sp. NBC_00853]